MCPPMTLEMCVFVCAQACVHVTYLLVVFSRDLLSRSAPWPLFVQPCCPPIIPLSANAALTLIPKRITLHPRGLGASVFCSRGGC